MGTAVDVNGTSYTVPAVGEGNWGAQVSALLIALSSGLLQRKGGSFTLTADVDFGATFGLKAVKFSSRNTPATTGVIRLGNDESVSWRNAGNTLDKSLKLNTSDVLEFDGSPMLTLALGAANTVLKMNAGGTAYEFGLLANANIDAAAAIAATKIGAGDVDNTELSYLNGVTSSIQTQLNAKLDDFTSSTDNRIMRTNGTTGEAIQESLASIDDSGNISGLANIRMSGDLDMATAVAMNIGATNATTINVGRSGQTVVFPGNIQVDGTTTTVNSQNLDVTDANITVNNGGNQASATGVAGLTVEMSDATDVLFIYDSTLASRWKIGDSGALHQVLTTGHAQTITALKTIDTELLVKQIATPSNPASGYNKIYPKSDDKLYYLNSAGLEQEIGSGSGSGSVTFIDNGDFEDGTTTGWSTYDDGASAVPVDGTGGTSANLTISSEGTVELNGTYCMKVAKGAADAQGEGAVKTFTIPKAYRNIKNAISLVYSTDGAYAAGDMAVFLYDVDTSTLITPRISEITGYDKDNPGSVKYRTDFDVADTTSVNYRFLFHCTSTNASAYDLYVDDIEIGPGELGQGTVVGPWKSYVPEFSAGFGTVTGLVAFYREVGESVEVLAQWANGTVAASEAQIGLPNSWTVGRSDFTGRWQRRNVATASALKAGTLFGIAGNSYINFGSDDYTQALAPYSPLNVSVFSVSAQGMSAQFTVPIAELEGKTASNLGANDVEYAFNTDTSDANDTTSFGYGTSGVAFPSSALTTSRDKTVQFQTDIQDDDTISLQVDPSGNGDWAEIGSMSAGLISARLVEPLRQQNAVTYGIGIRSVGSNSVIIRIGQYSYASGSTYGSAGNAWSATTGVGKWRVVKHRSGIPVGFGNATSEHSGLLRANKWQQKFYTGTATSAATLITFNGLEAGKLYKYHAQMYSSSGSSRVDIKENSNVVSRVSAEASAMNGSQSGVFEATGTAATMEWNTGSVNGDGAAGRTWMILEEFANGETTTDFT